MPSDGILINTAGVGLAHIGDLLEVLKDRPDLRYLCDVALTAGGVNMYFHDPFIPKDKILEVEAAPVDTVAGPFQHRRGSLYVLHTELTTEPINKSLLARMPSGSTLVNSASEELPHDAQKAAPDRSEPWAVLKTIPWPLPHQWEALQDTIWAGHPKLAPGWIRAWSQSQDGEFYLRLKDGFSTFDAEQAVAWVSN